MKLGKYFQKTYKKLYPGTCDPITHRNSLTAATRRLFLQEQQILFLLRIFNKDTDCLVKFFDYCMLSVIVDHCL